MGAQRAAWQAAFRAEAAAAGHGEYGQILFDLVKAFEKIPRQHLVTAAARHGYDLRILRLSLAAYRIPRTIDIDGVASRCITAVLGIIAGSGYATAETQDAPS